MASSWPQLLFCGRGCLFYKKEGIIMENIKLLNAYFSPTGGTAKTAAAVAAGACCPVSVYDLCERGAKVPDDYTALLAAVPVYGGRVPAPALERLAMLKGKGRPAAALAVYGNRAYEDALAELEDTLVKAGFRVVAAAAFIAEHSIVRSVAAGRPDAEDLKKAGLWGAELAKKFVPGQSLPEAEIPGNRPYKTFSPLPVQPQADESCIKCGLCAAKCPAGAIDPQAPDQTDASRCIVCMRCIEICPVHARTVPAPFMASVTDYLKETASGRKEPETF